MGVMKASSVAFAHNSRKREHTGLYQLRHHFSADGAGKNSRVPKITARCSCKLQNEGGKAKLRVLVLMGIQHLGRNGSSLPSSLAMPAFHHQTFKKRCWQNSSHCLISQGETEPPPPLHIARTSQQCRPFDDSCWFVYLLSRTGRVP